jgi:tetratricopeptide (TPR) repeat protein
VGLLAVVLGAAVPGAAVAQLAPETAARVDSVFADLNRTDGPGCALGVVRDGQLAYGKGYGIANLDYRRPITPETNFYMASVSKHVVAAAVIEAIRHVLFPGVPRQLREALEEGGQEALTDTYQSLKRRYPPERFDESLLNRLGYTLLRMEEVENAIAVFKLNVEEYPEAPNPYDSLGDAYRAAGQLKAAKRQYERAVALAKEQGHPNLETFRNNLKEVTKQLEEKN